MNKIAKTLAVIALAAAVAPFASQAAVPASVTQNVPYQMNYQGRLVNPANGQNYTDGIYTLDIRIWNVASGTSSSACLWGAQYAVYVKDGYFNIMLGDTSGRNLADGVLPKYKYNELWKALWGESNTAVNYFLGVTPHESATHATISNPTEILPRQSLLTAPFAFRSHQAYYAIGCVNPTFTVYTNLTVNGETTLKGKVTFNGQISATGSTQTLGPVKVTSNTNGTSVNLGNGTTVPNADNKSSIPYALYGVSQYLYLRSYYGTTIAPTAGDVTVTVPSDKKMYVTGSGSFVSDTPVNTIGGNSTTTIKGSSVAINSGSTKKISVNSSTTTITNQTVNAEGSYINLKASNTVEGQGKFRWAPAGKTLNTGTVIPFQFKKVTMVVQQGNSEVKYNLGAASSSDHIWSVCGFQGGGYAPAPNSMYTYIENGYWYLKVQLTGSATGDWTYHVHCMGVHKDFSTDVR